MAAKVNENVDTSSSNLIKIQIQVLLTEQTESQTWNELSIQFWLCGMLPEQPLDQLPSPSSLPIANI